LFVIYKLQECGGHDPRWVAAPQQEKEIVVGMMRFTGRESFMEGVGECGGQDIQMQLEYLKEGNLFGDNCIDEE
jgi:hypothetical protein